MLQIDSVSHAPFFTLELPWRDNRRGESCIPEGTYLARKYVSPKYGDTWIIDPVPERSGILMHAGNTVTDTEGCILVGTRAGMLQNRPAVLNSRNAINALQSLLEDEFYVVMK